MEERTLQVDRVVVTRKLQGIPTFECSWYALGVGPTSTSDCPSVFALLNIPPETLEQQQHLLASSPDGTELVVITTRDQRTQTNKTPPGSDTLSPSTTSRESSTLASECVDAPRWIEALLPLSAGTNLLIESQMFAAEEGAFGVWRLCRNESLLKFTVPPEPTITTLIIAEQVAKELTSLQVKKSQFTVVGPEGVAVKICSASQLRPRVKAFKSSTIEVSLDWPTGCRPSPGQAEFYFAKLVHVPTVNQDSSGVVLAPSEALLEAVTPTQLISQLHLRLNPTHEHWLQVEADVPLAPDLSFVYLRREFSELQSDAIVATSSAVVE